MVTATILANMVIEAEGSNFLATKLEKNPLMSLKEQTILYNEQFTTSIASETVRRHLDGLFYTLKQCHYEPEPANTK